MLCRAGANASMRVESDRLDRCRKGGSVRCQHTHQSTRRRGDCLLLRLGVLDGGWLLVSVVEWMHGRVSSQSAREACQGGVPGQEQGKADFAQKGALTADAR